MYCRLCSHAHHVCLSVYLSAATCPHCCTDPDVTWDSGRGCPLVVHCWADLQSVHRLPCYGNITPTQNVRSMPNLQFFVCGGQHNKRILMKFGV